MISLRKTLAVTSIALALAACGGGSIDAVPSTGQTGDTTSSGVTGPASLVLLSDGSTLHAATVTATGYAETGVASIPAATGVAGDDIYGMVVHPNKKWVYVSSSLSYSTGNPRIDRFSLDWTTGALTYVDGYDLSVPTAGPSCATGGSICTPVGLGVTADGTRLIVEENTNDTFLTFAIAADGSLSFVNEAASGITSDHGVGINAAGTYLYHGSAAYGRSGDTITALGNAGQYGNASKVLNIGGTEKLYTTLDMDQIGILSLADPANPSVIAALNPDPANAGSPVVFMDETQDGSRIVSVGDNSISIVDFDGAALTVRSQLAPTGRGRGAAISADGSLAVATFLTGSRTSQSGYATLYSVAADGTLAQVGSITTSGVPRAVVFATRP